MNNEKELTHIDLFSGIGGFTLAGEWAGFRTIAFCEKDEFCQKVLKKHWPEIPIIPEIQNVDGTKWREATLLTGGFPCQPFSIAGQQRGKEDDCYLWPEMLRVINEAKPYWILAENVPGIFRMALDTVLTDLEGKGYTTGTFIIPACGLNAPHKRNRVWIVANLSGMDGTWSIKKKNNRELQGCDEHRGYFEQAWIQIATKFCRVDDGVPDRIHRLKALGNAIVPQIAYEILKNIAWIEKNYNSLDF